MVDFFEKDDPHLLDHKRKTFDALQAGMFFTAQRCDPFFISREDLFFVVARIDQDRLQIANLTDGPNTETLMNLCQGGSSQKVMPKLRQTIYTYETDSVLNIIPREKK